MDIKGLYPISTSIFGLRLCMKVRSRFGSSTLRSIETILHDAEFINRSAQEFADSIFN